MYQKPYIIAEAGCNHMGQMDIARDMIQTAATFCKADAIKFQKRCPKELLTEEQYNLSYQNNVNSFGKTYGEHREFLEFTIEQHGQLKNWCKEAGITYGCSVWDLTSAKEITSLNPKFMKIPSACNNHYKMLRWLCENYFGEIHISLGMTTREEEKQIIDLFGSYNRTSDLVLFSCTSGYPVSFKDVCLLEMNRIQDSYLNQVKAIGFSGHHLGIAVDIAAYTLGAHYIERHYTLDRTWKGTDQAASLEPDGVRKLVRDMNAVYHSLSYKQEEILPVELEQRKKLKFRER